MGGGSGGSVYIKANEIVSPTIDVRGAPGGTGIYGEVNCPAGKGGGGAGGIIVLDTSSISSCTVRGVREEGYFSDGCTYNPSANVVSDTISEGTNINPSYKPDSGDILLRGGYAVAVDNKLLANAGVIVFPSLVPSGGGFAQIEKHTRRNGHTGPETATFNSDDNVFVQLKITNPIGVGSATITDEIPSGAPNPTYDSGGNGTLTNTTITWSNQTIPKELKYHFKMP